MRNDRRGNMPFAVIAVTILLMSTVAGAVVAGHQTSEDNVKEVEEGTRAIGSSLDAIVSYVEQELGSVMLTISKDASLGTLDERASAFAEWSGRWLDENFPMRSNDIVATLVGSDLELTAEPMGLVVGDTVDGYAPSYLHGAGTVTLRVSSQFGSMQKTVPISTDGSYALPLACEQGSLFERMVADGGISISQIMTYELTSVAQLRVLNGYGSQSEYGPRGTESILTTKDVRTAYENAMDLIGTICFRDYGGNDIHGRADPADMLAGDEIVIDVSAFYGQALTSVLDDMALKWFDYLGINYLADCANTMDWARRSSTVSLLDFIEGRSPDASGYIADVMAMHNISEDVYRHPGTGSTTVSLNGYEVTVENPVADIFQEQWIKTFKQRDRAESNYVKDLMEEVLNTASMKVFGEDRQITVKLDPYDETSFLDRMYSVYMDLASECEKALDEAVRGCTESLRFSDPFYAKIAETVQEHSGSFALVGTLEAELRDAFSELVDDEEVLDGIMASGEVAKALQAYKSKVYGDLETYDILKTVPGGEPGIVVDVLSDIVSFGLRASGITSEISDATERIVGETLSVSDMNPLSGVLDLPGTESFRLMDGDDNVTRERLFFEYESNASFSNPAITKKCIHLTGFREDESAAYSTVFSIRIDDAVSYRIEGKSTLSSAYDDSITSASYGSFLTGIDLCIPVASGWALVGVEYSASCTILSDAFSLALKILEPIMEPLRKVMEAIRSVIEVLNEALMRIATYVADALSKLYDAIMGPLTEIAEWIEEKISAGLLDYYYSLDLSKQSVSVEYLGYTFTLDLNVASMASNTKTLFTATLNGPVGDLDVTASLTAKAKGDMNLKNVFITGSAVVVSDDWKVKMAMDPLMKSSKHLLTVSAEIDDAVISAVLPDLDNYHEIRFNLRGLDGIGDMLDNIPIPGLGIKIGLDAGATIRYSDPSVSGLVINEYETNPPGSDKGHEWVELLNNSGIAVDLEGYTLLASSDYHTKTMKLSGTISPGEFMVVEPTFSMVNSSGKLTKNGEGLTLKDPDGVIVDKTGTHKDSSDDGCTWQRTFDCSTEWTFKEGTMGRSNGTYAGSRIISADILKDIAWKSVQDAFSEAGPIESLDGMQKIIELSVKKTVDRAIEHVAGCLVEASVYVKVEIKDAASMASGGVKVALRCDSDLLEDTLKYIAGKIESVAMSIKNPYRIDPVAMFTDNIDLEVCADAKIQYPSILRKTDDKLPNVDLCLVFRTNMSALCKVFGKDAGTPEIECGIRMDDCPSVLIPPSMSPKGNMDHDLWLLKMNVQWK